MYISLSFVLFLQFSSCVYAGLMVTNEGAMYDKNNRNISSVDQLRLYGYEVKYDNNPSLWDGAEVYPNTYLVKIFKNGKLSFYFKVFQGEFVSLVLVDSNVSFSIGGAEVRVGGRTDILTKIDKNYHVGVGEMTNYIILERYPKISFGTSCDFHTNPEMRPMEYRGYTSEEVLKICEISEIIIREASTGMKSIWEAQQ